MRFWRTAFFLFLALLAGTAGFNRTADAEHLIQCAPTGWINWSEQVFCAAGKGIPSADTLQAREQAFVKARRHAYQNLLETIKSVQLTSSLDVRRMVRDKDHILANLEEILNNAQIEKTSYLSDGTVEIVKQISITGAFSQLMLPEAIVQLEMKRMGRGAVEGNLDNIGVYTGLIVDARRIDIRPSLSFKIVDEGGKEVYGPAYVSREHAVQHGMCEYWTEIKDAEALERVGVNPLIVRGLKPVGPGGADIVISNSDASRLRSAVDHLFLLRKCRVVVITNPVPADNQDDSHQANHTEKK